jgi:hypothetical protein
MRFADPEALVEVANEPNESVRKVHGIRRSRVQMPQGARQALKLPRRVRLQLVERDRRVQSPSPRHHLFEQRLARVAVLLEGDDVPMHPPRSVEATPDLLASGQVALPRDRLRRGRPAYSCSL